MSGRATLTTVTSSSSMNVAIETSSRVHHLRSIAQHPKQLPCRPTRFASDSQMPELVSYALVEARSRQLRQAADRIEEADLELRPRRQLGDPAAVDGDLDRL